jgi:probable F420-dependent oxidoreductase
MNIGAVFPTTEIGTDPGAIRDWVQTAESLGYSHVLTYDHVLGAEHARREPALGGPYTERDPFHEPMTLFAYMAGLTEKIELATGILILPQRQTVLVAKQAAEIDLLSRGRFRLGLGTGWNYVEYDSLGVPFEGRGKRLDEQVDLLRKLWQDSVIDFAGEYHRVERAGILPLPRPDLPIWFGGFTEVALRRAARVGDGFVFGTTATRMTGMLQRLREMLVAEGRDAENFPTEAVIDFSSSPSEWHADLEAWRKAGGTHLGLRAMDTAAEFVGSKRVGFEGPKDYIRALETVHRELGAEAFAPEPSSA